jgi:adenine phosphoribosyltransferase
LQPDLRDLVRSIPDFPKQGIVFRDVTTLLKDGPGFKQAIRCLADEFRNGRIDRVVCIEARGFILGGALAFDLGCGVVVVRKPGKLPAETVSQKYELEYGTDTIEMHKDALTAGDRVLLVDDLLATGGTARAAADLIERLGGAIVGCAFLIEIAGLRGRRLLDKYKVFSLIEYE